MRYDTASATYTLQLKDVQRSDEGRYECQIIVALNNKVTKSLYLKVLEPPVINDNSTRRFDTIILVMSNFVQFALSFWAYKIIPLNYKCFETVNITVLRNNKFLNLTIIFVKLILNLTICFSALLLMSLRKQHWNAQQQDLHLQGSNGEELIMQSFQRVVLFIEVKGSKFTVSRERTGEPTFVWQIMVLAKQRKDMWLLRLNLLPTWLMSKRMPLWHKHMDSVFDLFVLLKLFLLLKYFGIIRTFR